MLHPQMADRAVGVEAVWRIVSGDSPAAVDLSIQLGCPLPIARVLVSRGIRAADEAEAFLNPRLEAVIDSPACDPMQMLGMAAAVERILAAIRAGEPILIYGDYDVDGTTATVLLKTAIERVGLAMEPQRRTQVSYHVPHRIREGYGIQSSVLAEAAGSGIRLVISVDTGIRAVVEAVEARRLGLDLIVTDHHLPGDAADLPDAFAVINPAQPGCSYPNKNLCGAAVAFRLAQALLTAVSPETADPGKWLARVRGTILPSFLKLVAIATIADSVALAGENRAIAALGLAALANPVHPGLRALMQLAGIPAERAPTASEVGFRIAPRINAAGRMDIASDVVELFLTRDRERAQELAAKLDRLNQERRDSEARALDAIDRELLALLGENGAYPPDCLILDDRDWHRGVLGILASRVVERTGRPALILTHADGDAHGSGRSVPGFHLLDAITAVNAAETTAAEVSDGGCFDLAAMGGPVQDGSEAMPLFHRFGGHAHAVGFSLPSSRLPLFRQRMKRYASSHLDAAILIPQLEYDAELVFPDLTPGFAAWLARCAPFGIGNREPVFLTRNVTLSVPVRLIQEKHICLQLVPARVGQVDGSSRGGGNGDGRNLPAIPALGWSHGVMNWVAYCSGLGLAPGSIVDILYRVKRNTGPYAGPNFDGLELELRGLRLAGAG
jgi:single-stranded-DNA-specific exonuclease